MAFVYRVQSQGSRQLHEFPGSFSDPRAMVGSCPVAAGYVCNLQTKGEARGEKLKGLMSRCRLDFNRFTTLAPHSSSLSPFFFLHLTLSSYPFLFLSPSSPIASPFLFSVARFNKLIRVGRRLFFRED